MKEKTAIFAASFNPITYGHIDIINRALKHFDFIHVVVAYNSAKKYSIPIEDRLFMVREVFLGCRMVEVSSWDGLIVDRAKEFGTGVLIRGLRNCTDLDYEFSISNINSNINRDLETFFLATKPKYAYISSSVVRELLLYNGDISSYVPQSVESYLKTLI